MSTARADRTRRSDADLAADDIDGYRRAAGVTIASDLVDVVGATLAVLVIRRTTDRL